MVGANEAGRTARGKSLKAMRNLVVLGAGRLLVALALLGAPLAAAAQETGTADDAAASPVAGAAADQAPAPLDEHDSALLAQALSYDPASLAADAPAKPLKKVPSLTSATGPAITGTDKDDGSGTVAIKQSLPTTWNAKLGVDLDVAAPPVVSYQPDKPLPGTAGANTGAAWASMDVTRYATVEARVDPSNDSGHVGTTLQHSLDLGRDLSLTLRDDVKVSDTLGTSQGAAAAPAGLPVMALPRSTTSAATEPVWENKPGVKLKFLATDTTLAANLTNASNDSVTHNTLSAEQTLYGPLHVTTSVTDLGSANVNKSITASIKLNW